MNSEFAIKKVNTKTMNSKIGGIFDMLGEFLI